MEVFLVSEKKRGVFVSVYLRNTDKIRWCHLRRPVAYIPPEGRLRELFTKPPDVRLDRTCPALLRRDRHAAPFPPQRETPPPLPDQRH